MDHSVSELLTHLSPQPKAPSDSTGEAGKGNNSGYFNQSLLFTISSQKGRAQARTDITWLNGLLQKVSLNLPLFKGIIERL